MEKFDRFFCANCGKWLGVKKENSDIDGIYPYCTKCRKQVEITTTQMLNTGKTYFSAECQQH